MHASEMRRTNGFADERRIVAHLNRGIKHVHICTAARSAESAILPAGQARHFGGRMQRLYAPEERNKARVG